MPAAALALASALLGSTPAVNPTMEPPPRLSIVAACTASAPAEGQGLSGPVLQVMDGRTLCVAKGPTPDQWIQVRLSDVYDREARGALMAAAFAKDVDCRIEGRGQKGAIARCNVGGAPLGQLVGSGAGRIQAAAWR